MEKKRIASQDLTEHAPVMTQADNVVIARHVSFEDFLTLFDEDVHGKIRGAALTPGVTHVVCLENLDFWSSRIGQRTALIVGEKQKGAEIPTWTLKALLSTPYFRLGNVPSRFQYPVAYASVKELQAELPPEGKLDVKDYDG